MKDESADFGWQRNASLEGERGGATRIAGRGPAKKTMLSSGHASRGGGFHVFRSCKHGSGISRISSSSYKRDGLLSLDAHLCHGGVFCASSPRGDILREKKRTARPGGWRCSHGAVSPCSFEIPRASALGYIWRLRRVHAPAQRGGYIDLAACTSPLILTRTSRGSADAMR